MNIGIFLRQFKKTNEEIVAALRDGNDEIMSKLIFSLFSAAIACGALKLLFLTAVAFCKTFQNLSSSLKSTT